jgi:hypothetical protein
MNASWLRLGCDMLGERLATPNHSDPRALMPPGRDSPQRQAVVGGGERRGAVQDLSGHPCPTVLPHSETSREHREYGWTALEGKLRMKDELFPGYR